MRNGGFLPALSEQQNLVSEVLGAALSLGRSDLSGGMEAVNPLLAKGLVVLGWAWTGSSRAGQSGDLGFPPSWERKERSALFLVEESPTGRSL